MATENNERYEKSEHSEMGEIGNRVRYIQRRVGEISEQLDDQYRVLREIWETTTERENGEGWYDFYETGDEPL